MISYRCASLIKGRPKSTASTYVRQSDLDSPVAKVIANSSLKMDGKKMRTIVVLDQLVWPSLKISYYEQKIIGICCDKKVDLPGENHASPNISNLINKWQANTSGQEPDDFYEGHVLLGQLELGLILANRRFLGQLHLVKSSHIISLLKQFHKFFTCELLETVARNGKTNPSCFYYPTRPESTSPLPVPYAVYVQCWRESPRPG